MFYSLIMEWACFMAALVVFYRLGGGFVEKYIRLRYPDAPTSNVHSRLVEHMVKKSYRAFPLYVCVPMLLNNVVSFENLCTSVSDCGGCVVFLCKCIFYFLLLEFLIFVIHYYILHKMGCFHHDCHHVYKYRNQLNCFAGYSFSPLDGFSQGFCLVLSLYLMCMVVRVPILFVYGMEVVTGIWTMYIHTDITPLPWPLMGCDYHNIHHRYNWYNFGFMTVLFDWAFGTLRHPPADSVLCAKGTVAMNSIEKDRSRAATMKITGFK